MTRARIRQVVEHYTERLGLGAWDITVDFDTALTKGSNAEVAWDWSYDNATLRLDPVEWKTWEDAFAERVVAHELVHVLLRDISVAAHEIIDRAPEEARPYAEDRWSHELEGVTERLAVILAGS